MSTESTSMRDEISEASATGGYDMQQIVQGDSFPFYETRQYYGKLLGKMLQWNKEEQVEYVTPSIPTCQNETYEEYKARLDEYLNKEEKETVLEEDRLTICTE